MAIPDGYTHQPHVPMCESCKFAHWRFDFERLYCLYGEPESFNPKDIELLSQNEKFAQYEISVQYICPKFEFKEHNEESSL